MESTLGFATLVAFEAAGLEERLDALPEIDSLCRFCCGLGAEGCDFLREEVVNRVVGGKAIGQGGNGWRGIFGEPLIGECAAFFPVGLGVFSSA